MKDKVKRASSFNCVKVTIRPQFSTFESTHRLTYFYVRPSNLDMAFSPFDEARKGWYQSGSQAERNRLRRMRGAGRMVVFIFADAPNAVTSAAVIIHASQHASKHHVCRHGSPDYHEFRAGRGGGFTTIVMQGILLRPAASRASLASVRSTDAWASRTGAFKLANAASTFNGERLCGCGQSRPR